MLDKVNMYKVMMCLNSTEQAQICMNQASFIVQKYGLNFNLNIDINKIMLENPIGGKSEKVEEKLEENSVENSELKSAKRIAQPKFESDGEVVDPSQFFS